MAEFERALKQLITDAEFRYRVIEDWEVLRKEFSGLDGDELMLLMQVLNATATDDETLQAITLCHCCCATIEA